MVDVSYFPLSLSVQIPPDYLTLESTKDWGSDKCRSLEEAERVMCPNNPDRECFYPHRCEAGGCYFLNREQPRREQLEQSEQQQRIDLERRERQQRDWQEQEQEKRQWAELQEWFDQRRGAS